MPPEAAGTVAVTGATGFIGRRLIPALAAAGWQPRILTRRDPATPLWQGLAVETVAGDLADAGARRRLVSGASAVVHLAGLIKARDEAAFMAVNGEGTRQLAATLRERMPQARLLYVSSLAAREPQLSTYACSKRAGEDAARDVLGAQLQVLRPAAVYGPGDRETLVFFQLARLPRVPLLGSRNARLTVVHVDDLCTAIVAALRADGGGTVRAVCDARPQGYGWQALMQAAADALGRREPRFFAMPRAALRLLAWTGDLARRAGSVQMLGSEKLRELLHEDWSIAPGEALEGWRPRYGLEDGFADAAAWYRGAGWLPA